MPDLAEPRKEYRKGAVGALMDEYERAGEELTRLIAGLTDAEFEAVRDLQTKDEDCRSIQTVVHHTAATLEGRWEMPVEQASAARIQSRWGQTYDFEQMLEHAIVHVLRHRRQIERFLRA